MGSLGVARLHQSERAQLLFDEIKKLAESGKKQDAYYPP